MDLVAGLEGLGADSETQRLQSIYDHLLKTRNLIASKPELISSVDYPPAFIKMLDYAIDNWYTPNRDKALQILAKNEDAPLLFLTLIFVFFLIAILLVAGLINFVIGG